jgi:hypothetical protein
MGGAGARLLSIPPPWLPRPRPVADVEGARAGRVQGVAGWAAVVGSEHLRPQRLPLPAVQPPNFAYNFGTEGGVFLRFIVDFYHDLPDVTVFLHGGNPADHNPRVWDLVRCLRPDATFAPLNDVFVHNRSVAEFSFYGWSVWLEQCWRDFLAAFNVTVLPRQRVGVSFTCCSQFAVSRRTLRRHSLETYRQALRIAGEPPEVCHEGPADRRALWATRLPGQKLWRERPLHHGRHTAGLAFEHLNHIVLGGQPFHARPYTQVSLCQQFLPNRHLAIPLLFSPPNQSHPHRS